MHTIEKIAHCAPVPHMPVFENLILNDNVGAVVDQMLRSGK